MEKHADINIARLPIVNISAEDTAGMEMDADSYTKKDSTKEIPDADMRNLKDTVQTMNANISIQMEDNIIQKDKEQDNIMNPNLDISNREKAGNLLDILDMNLSQDMKNQIEAIF